MSYFRVLKNLITVKILCLRKKGRKKGREGRRPNINKQKLATELFEEFKNIFKTYYTSTSLPVTRIITLI